MATFHHPASRTNGFSIAALLVALLFGATVGYASSYLYGVDYMPLVWAWRLLLAGESVYGPAMDQLFRATYGPGFADGGFAYPLPAIWLVLPIVPLPYALGKAVWCVMCLGSVLLGMTLLRMPRPLFLLVALLWGIAELQNTVLLTGLLLLAVWAWRTKRWWLLAALVGLTVAAKPQTMALLAGALMLLTVRARQWRPLLTALLLFVGVPFLLEPNWIALWLHNVGRYSSHIVSMWLIGWVPLAGLLAWRRQWWAALALLQVACFPIIRHHYALLPLLIGYVDLGSTRKAWLVVACSWATIPLAPFVPTWLLLTLGYALPLCVVLYNKTERALPEPVALPRLQEGNDST